MSSLSDIRKKQVLNNKKWGRSDEGSYGRDQF